MCPPKAEYKAIELYCWMCMASEGGYLGIHAASVFTVVVSGAAGAYAVPIAEYAWVSTDLMVELGQDACAHQQGSRRICAPS